MSPMTKSVVADPGGAKVECQREDPGTEEPRRVVRASATGGGVWEGDCPSHSRAPPQEIFSHLGLKYTIFVLHSGRFFRFSLAGFNASNVPDDLDYLLIFISTSE